MAPLIRELRRSGRADVCVIVTGQHADLLRPVLDFFEIDVDVDLQLMRPDQSLADLTGRMLRKIDAVFAAQRPQMVLAQGDTTTAFVAALGAIYRRIPFGHVEAGLRTGDKTSPFPEEMHRVLAGRLADWHFAPTASAANNLLREGVSPERVFTTGNTVVDALRLTAEREQPRVVADLGNRKLVLLTVHRRENFGPPLEAICRAVRRLAERDDVLVLCPVHPNPAVGEVLRGRLGGLAGVRLTPPLDYPQFIACMRQAHLILTDSGGIQEEAPYLGKPVLVLRNTTERPEAVAAGAARLVGTCEADIVREAARLLDDSAAYRKSARPTDLYGDGFAAQRIAAVLLGEAFSNESKSPEPTNFDGELEPIEITSTC